MGWLAALIACFWVCRFRCRFNFGAYPLQWGPPPPPAIGLVVKGEGPTSLVYVPRLRGFVALNSTSRKRLQGAAASLTIRAGGRPPRFAADFYHLETRPEGLLTVEFILGEER